MRTKTALDKISNDDDTLNAYSPLTTALTSGLAGAGIGALSSLAFGRDSSTGKRLARGVISGATSGIGFSLGGDLGDHATGGNMRHLYDKSPDEIRMTIKDNPEAAKVYGLGLLGLLSGSTAGGIAGHVVGSYLGNALLGRPGV